MNTDIPNPEQQHPAAQGGIEAWDAGPQDTFIAVYEDVWQHLKGTQALFIYMALKRRTTPGRRNMFGKRTQLADEAGVSLNTFDRHLPKLIRDGLVQRIARYVPKGWDGDPAHIEYQRTDTARIQIGNTYKVRFHMPTTPSPKEHPSPPQDQTPLPLTGGTEKNPKREEPREKNPWGLRPVVTHRPHAPA